METRFLNCPFCGGRPNIDRWVNLTENGVIYCAACDFTLPPTVWNRRTPDLTEALCAVSCRLLLADRVIKWCRESKPWNFIAGFDAIRIAYDAAEVEVFNQDSARTTNPGSPATGANPVQPQLTEALARLKALEEEMRSTKSILNATPLQWADEIADIRKELGASDAEPRPEP